MSKKVLSEKEELILCRYFDNESGFFEAHRAQRLLRNREYARDFVASLKDVKGAIVNTELPVKGVSSNLWNRIEQRIEQEEKASFYLGERRASGSTTQEAPLHWRGFFSTQALLGGLSGAATTAAVLLLLSGTNLLRVTDQPVGRSMASNMSSSSTNGFSQVGLSSSPLENGFSSGFSNSRVSSSSLSSSQQAPRPLLYGQRQNSVMEVDWVRGDGPLRVIQNPSERSTIIWVKRQGNQGVKKNRNARGPGEPRVELTAAPESNSQISGR